MSIFGWIRWGIGNTNPSRDGEIAPGVPDPEYVLVGMLCQKIQAIGVKNPDHIAKKHGDSILRPETGKYAEMTRKISVKGVAVVRVATDYNLSHTRCKMYPGAKEIFGQKKSNTTLSGLMMLVQIEGKEVYIKNPDLVEKLCESVACVEDYKTRLEENKKQAAVRQQAVDMIEFLAGVDKENTNASAVSSSG